MPTTAQTPSTKNTGYYINSLITVVLIFCFGFLPPIDPITPIGMKILGILLGLLYGWTFVGLLWPSLLGTLAIGLSGAMPIKTVFMTGYGSDITLLILFIFVFAAMVESAGVSKAIAMWLVTRKIFLGRPWVFSFILLFAAFLLSATTSTIAAIIICWGIVYRICAELGYKSGDKWPALMVLGVVFACTIGLSLFPFKSVPLVVVGSYTAMSGIDISFFKYVCFTAPIGILSLLLYILLCKFIFRPNITNLTNLTMDTFGEDAQITLNGHQKIVISFLLAMIIFLLVPSLLPANWLIARFLNGIGSTGVVMLLLAIMCLFKYQGKPLLNFRQMAIEGIQWDVVILTATVVPLISLITADSTGIKPFLSAILQPIFQGKPDIIFISLVILFSIILTNLCNNAVTGVLFVAITYTFATDMGINTAMLTMLIVLCVHLAILTPAGSPMAAVLHGNRQWISAADIYKYGATAIFSICILLIIVGIPLATFIF